MPNNIKLICFDMDDTLISQNSWYKLNLSLGVTHEEDLRMYNSYEKGELSYENWTKSLLNLYKKHGKATESYIKATLEDFILNPEAKVVVDYLKNKGYRLAVVSGSFDTLVYLVAKELGISHKKACTSLIYDDSSQLVDIKTGGDEGSAKLRHLENICETIGITVTECACVGDGANDLEMFEATLHGITFKDSSIKDSAWKTINSLKDLTTIF
jgi:phosphoserine phosphatase